MDGQVSISLEDFKKLEYHAEGGLKAIKLVKELDDELSYLLEYIGHTNDIEQIAETYNKQGHKRLLKLEQGGWRLAKRS
tara:strand:+ start:149 stop:385 length:237 start_codon:yes stop_codon:yes gene_type:complete